MSKCRYNLEKDCHDKDCVDCVLEDIKAEILNLREETYKKFGHQLGFEYIWAYDKCLEIIDKHIGKEQE